MLLGIDVGGTHTDAVYIDQGGIAAISKIPTDHDNLLSSIRAALEEVLAGVDKSSITRLNLSTTLSTNLLVEGKAEEVGVLVSAGPGIDPALFAIGENYHVIPGALDHRGEELAPVNQNAVDKALASCLDNGVRVFASVGKFSTRNPAHERAVKQRLLSQADHVTNGYRLSGRRGFPRRIVTAYFNSAVWRTFNRFADAVQDGLKGLGLAPAVNILKADGGTMPLNLAREVPVHSILSGPAASVMGMMGICDLADDAVILDIGGTTTDIAVVAWGEPLMRHEGLSLNSRPTLVRALEIRSIGIGGDSRVTEDNGRFTVGPERLGPCMARGGPEPTLVDCLNVLGISSYGDASRSEAGIRDLAERAGAESEKAAALAVDAAVSEINLAIEQMLAEINAKPVYTVHELLEGKRVEPERIYVMGGPARALVHPLEKACGLEVVAPKNFAVANAIGAALTRRTRSADLFADTARARMIIPSLDVVKEIPKSYDLEQAKSDAIEHLLDYLKQNDPQAPEDTEAEIIEASSFNMVEDFYTSGRDIRVRCQLKPGLDEKYSNFLRDRC